MDRRLEEYGRKRRSDRTPEPSPESGGQPARTAPAFVVHRHLARRLHYDLRLEWHGALASWAVPRGLPFEPGERRLAVRVEDHPLAYLDFSGEIPEGEYGAGAVEIWDAGTYELLEEKSDGGLTVRLRGQRLEGVWTLVPAALGGQERNWLLVRKQEPAGARGVARTLRARSRYAPMLAVLSDAVPRGRGWSYELKWDGFRVLARIDGGEAALWSRTQKDLTERFSTIAAELPRSLRSPDCVVDGEVCALDDEGRPRFSLLQRGEGALVYELFDLLELDGVSLLDRPLAERRRSLEETLDTRARAVRLSAAFEDGLALFDAARSHGLEGVVAKRLDSPYQPGKRTGAWVKVKAHASQEFVIVGYTRGAGRRATTFGALVLAVRRGGELVWAGNVGTGFTEAEAERLLGLLRPLERRSTPLAVEPKMPRVRASGVVWVEPKLVCEVDFAEWTRDGHLRAPSYKGLREDKGPAEVVHERPRELEVRSGRRALSLRNLDKLFWPEEGITKGDLVEYYRRIAPVLVPHLRGRPFTMLRFPNGIAGKHFFQKNAPAHMPPWIPTAELPAHPRGGGQPRLIHYPLVNDELALLWVVSMGCIDMHPWLSRADRVDRPDAVVFDLDPAEGVPFHLVVEVALLVRDLLALLELECYPRTSGGDGMHVLVPIERRSTFEQTRAFAEVIAQTLVRTHPTLVTTEFRRAKRHGVLIDVNQNREGATTASVYSVRPRPGAPVATPLSWEEVDERLEPRAFSMEAVLQRVERHGDLHEPVLTERQPLARALRALA